jgi:hypothetical protein
MTPQERNCISIEDLIQQKIEEYVSAEREGQPYVVLAAIYKQIKALKYQVTFSSYLANSFQDTDSDSIVQTF